MKKLCIILLAFAIFALPALSQGQNAKEKDNRMNKGIWKNIPNITDTQKSRVNELRTLNMKKMTGFRNEMRVLRADLRILMTTEKPDMNAINTAIDKITKLENVRMRRKAQHIQDLRAVLTTEQRVIYDSNSNAFLSSDVIDDNQKMNSRK
jgi:Spy/CpxP family protein refolding chaperone